jgi:hypothetical protein
MEIEGSEKMQPNSETENGIGLGQRPPFRSSPIVVLVIGMAGSGSEI